MGREILIVGGGVVGLALAWRLRQGGAPVAVVERGRCGGATSTASAGLLQAAPELTVAAPAMLDLTIPGHRLWPEFVRELEAASGVSLGFGKRGVLAVSLDEPDDAVLDVRETRYREHGLPVERLSADAARRKERALGPGVRGGLLLRADSWVNPVALGRALTEAFRREGGRTYERERVAALTREGDRVTGVRTRTRRITADAVVIAAGAWSAPLLAPDLPPGVLAPARGQMIALGASDGDDGARAPFMQRAVTSPSVWTVPQNDGRLWVGGAKEPLELRESLDAEPRADTTARILESLRRLAPGAGALPFHEAAVGHPCRTRDRLPILGASARTSGLYFALGLYRAGILLAPETARILAPLVLRGDQDPRLLPFGVDRLKPSPAAP
ncbi:MAG TPA: FAD-dependent oxidoreductase [Candidatus Eisenbacteria bacterium]|nr:FAD-dependent oxidoreductase [Candidatus Eisenbacteria bacterium]